MKSVFAAVLFSLVSGVASASTLTIDYFQVPDNGSLPDFGTCCSSPPATLPNIALGSSLLGGLPVTRRGTKARADGKWIGTDPLVDTVHLHRIVHGHAAFREQQSIRAERGRTEQRDQLPNRHFAGNNWNGL